MELIAETVVKLTKIKVGSRINGIYKRIIKRILTSSKEKLEEVFLWGILLKPWGR